MIILSSSLVEVIPAVDGYLPPQNPPWPPTYNMSESLITMQCNSSGLSNPFRGAQFGIVSYDWSNAKAQWATSKPMDCEERLVEQAVMTKEAGAKHVFVYRNIVKALPWFSSVREKLLDPAYSGFFLPFALSSKSSSSSSSSRDSQETHHDPVSIRYHVPSCAAENSTKCSPYYHDQEQTPQVPTVDNPTPDGICTEYCDCGQDLPCGEYLFDHRNGTMLRTWLVEQYLLGTTAVGHPYIDGLFLDDFWCSDLLCEQDPSIAGCPCNDPVQGPTEVDRYAQDDMELSDRDIYDITLAWNETMKTVEEALLRHGAYTWWLMAGQQNANAWPYMLPSSLSSPSTTSETTKQEECIAILEEACTVDSQWQHVPKLFGFQVGNHSSLTRLSLDLAFFLLVRGPYTWAGWGVWGMTWPFNAEPSHGGLPPLPGGVPLPKELLPTADYGTPLDVCIQTSTSSGIFRREWSKVRVEIDCTRTDDEGMVASRLEFHDFESDIQ